MPIKTHGQSTAGPCLFVHDDGNGQHVKPPGTPYYIAMARTTTARPQQQHPASALPNFPAAFCATPRHACRHAWRIRLIHAARLAAWLGSPYHPRRQQAQRPPTPCQHYAHHSGRLWYQSLYRLAASCVVLCVQAAVHHGPAVRATRHKCQPAHCCGGGLQPINNLQQGDTAPREQQQQQRDVSMHQGLLQLAGHRVAFLWSSTCHQFSLHRQRHWPRIKINSPPLPPHQDQ